MLGYILIFVLVLGVVILVHEFGHFIFAKRAGILCHEFSIGMGPALYKFKKGETVYAIRAIPIGGYVSMAGEDPETDKIQKGQTVYLQLKNENVTDIYLYRPSNVNAKYAKVIEYDLYGKDGNKLFIQYEDKDGVNQFVYVNRDAVYHFSDTSKMQIAPYERCFESKPWLNRFLTVVAGAGFNFILAALIFIILNLISGVPVNKPIIGDIAHDSPAEMMGLEKGDKIISLKTLDYELNIEEWSDISTFMKKYTLEDEITVTVLRDGKEVEISLFPEIDIPTIGIGSGKKIDGAKIGYIQPNSNAYKAGLQVGDVITEISGTTNDDKNTKDINESREISKTNITSWEEIVEVMQNFYLAEEVSITVKRMENGKETLKTFEIQTIKALEPSNVIRLSMGIIQGSEFNFFKSIGNGIKDTGNVIGSVFQTLGLLFGDSNVGVGDLSGPVGIYDMTKTFAMAGFLSLLYWVAFISANIGFVNLLPLPALDGGRLIFLLIEAIVRRPINRKIEGYIHTVGFVLFMLLFLYVTFNDIIRIRG